MGKGLVSRTWTIHPSHDRLPELLMGGAIEAQEVDTAVINACKSTHVWA